MQTVGSPTALMDGRGLMATLRENFAANLKRLLRESGISQRSFAEKLGAPEANVSRWINQVNFPEDTMVDRITEALGTSYEELFQDPKSVAIGSDPIVRYLRDLAKARGYDLVKKS